MSMEVISKRRAKETPRLQLIEGGRKTTRPTSATAMNQHIRRSIFNVVFESELEIKRLQQVAMMFRLPEAKVLDALRETMRERLFTPPPASVRRAA
jgi:hypothetical protein